MEHQVRGVGYAYRKCAEELVERIRQACEMTLTLQEASEVSGYSQDHLRRLIRKGMLRNAGTKGSPRVFLVELPRKPRHIPANPPSVKRWSEEVILEVIEGGLSDE